MKRATSALGMLACLLAVATVTLIACSDSPLEPSEIRLLPGSRLTLDSYRGDRYVDVYWWAGESVENMPVFGQDTTPQVSAVKIFLSDRGPDTGFRPVIEREAMGADSARIEGLDNGSHYYLQLGLYDSSGALVKLSLPLMTSPGTAEEPIIAVSAPQADGPLYLSNVSWSPDASKIAIIKADRGSGPNLFVFDTALERYSQVTSFSHDSYRLMSVDWSPDGEYLAYTYTESWTFGKIDYRVWRISLESRIQQPLSSGRIDSDAIWIGIDELIFTKGTYEPPNIPELYRLGISSPATEAPITNDQQTRKYAPAFSPVNGKIVFSGDAVDHHSRLLYLVTLTGSLAGTAVRLTDNEAWSDIHPSWSPDGQIVYFASDRSGHYEIWAIDTASKLVAQVTGGVKRWVRRFNPKMSSAGDRIAFLESQPDGEHSLNIVEINRRLWPVGPWP